VINYREAYGLYACNGILFNHESPVRGETFVTRKITLALARIKVGLQETLYMGNLDARRDWGHAQDYVEMQWLMLQQQKPRDYVIATGERHSVREFIVLAAEMLEMKLSWDGEGLHEKARDERGNIVVAVDPLYFTPAEVETLLGDPTRAREELGWAPRISFPKLVREMVESDYQAARRDGLVRAHGFEAYSFHESTELAFQKELF
jgi:GDPmannose 4,6-dehydratase